MLATAALLMAKGGGRGGQRPDPQHGPDPQPPPSPRVGTRPSRWDGPPPRAWLRLLKLMSCVCPPPSADAGVRGWLLRGVGGPAGRLG